MACQKPAMTWLDSPFHWAASTMFNYRKLEEDLCEYVEIGDSDEINNGERLIVETDQQDIVIFRIAGELFAIDDICSHDDGPLGDGEIEEYQIVCPRHGARFDIRTGEVMTLPAVTDISAYPVREYGGKIELGIPK